MRGRWPMLQVGANAPCGLWQSEHSMKPSFTRCLEGMSNCARTVRVAAVAEFALLLGQQVLGRGRVVDGMATGAGHVVQRVLGAADVGAGQVAWRGRSRQVSSTCSGGISEKARGMVVLPPRASTCAWPGPWQPSQPVRSGGSCAGGDALVVRILVEVLPDVGVAGPADVAADEARRRASWRPGPASANGQKQQQEGGTHHVSASIQIASRGASRDISA